MFACSVPLIVSDASVYPSLALPGARMLNPVPVVGSVASKAPTQDSGGGLGGEGGLGCRRNGARLARQYATRGRAKRSSAGGAALRTHLGGLGGGAGGDGGDGGGGRGGGGEGGEGGGSGGDGGGEGRGGRGEGGGEGDGGLEAFARASSNDSMALMRSAASATRRPRRDGIAPRPHKGSTD